MCWKLKKIDLNYLKVNLFYCLFNFFCFFERVDVKLILKEKKWSFIL